jgi:hypothetical protein
MPNVTIKDYYLVSQAGDPRHLYGPYPLRRARREASGLYSVVSGDALAGRKTISRVDLLKLIQAGRVVIEDGTPGDRI